MQSYSSENHSNKTRRPAGACGLSVRINGTEHGARSTGRRPQPRRGQGTAVRSAEPGPEPALLLKGRVASEGSFYLPEPLLPSLDDGETRSSRVICKKHLVPFRAKLARRGRRRAAPCPARIQEALTVHGCDCVTVVSRPTVFPWRA